MREYCADKTSVDAKVAVKLPPYSYALCLLNQFEIFIGSDYHWYHRQHFHDKMGATYSPPHKQSVDKAWLCCFSVNLALGESYTCRVAPSFIIDETAASNSNTQISQDSGQVVAPPGIEDHRALALHRRDPVDARGGGEIQGSFYCR